MGDVCNWERVGHGCVSFLKVWIESPDLRGRGRNGQDHLSFPSWGAGLSWGGTELCFLHPLYTLS